MKSKMCDGCPKVMTDEKGVLRCWYDLAALGFWNDLFEGFECGYYENYKKRKQEKLNENR